jgi:hypothetical protein
MQTLNLAFTFLAISLVASAEEPSVNRLLHAIRAELPKGWAASYDEECSWLEVSRDEAVLCVSALPNGLGDEESESFAFAFRVVEVVHLEDYRRLFAENEQTRKKLGTIYQELIEKGVSHKFDSFLPRTKEEEMAVGQYEALKKSLHKIPDFYFGNVSLAWEFNSPGNPVIIVSDDRVRDECAKVQENVVRLLSKYEDAEQDGSGQPATRPESKSEGSDKPQSESEGRSR